MKTRYWSIFKQDWYSICSGHSAHETEDTCIRYQSGEWRNRTLYKCSNLIYNRLPNLWRWWVNLSMNKNRFTKRLQKWFPNLK